MEANDKASRSGGKNTNIVIALRDAHTIVVRIALEGATEPAMRPLIGDFELDVRLHLLSPEPFGVEDRHPILMLMLQVGLCFINNHYYLIHKLILAPLYSYSEKTAMTLRASCTSCIRTDSAPASHLISACTKLRTLTFNFAHEPNHLVQLRQIRRAREYELSPQGNYLQARAAACEVLVLLATLTQLLLGENDAQLYWSRKLLPSW